MTNDLRTRIAKVLYQRFAPQIGMADAEWDDEPHMVKDDYLRDADAVIRELKQEWRADFGYDGYAKCETRDEAKRQVDGFNEALGDDIRDGENAMVMLRWVTEWEVVDE